MTTTTFFVSVASLYEPAEAHAHLWEFGGPMPYSKAVEVPMVYLRRFQSLPETALEIGRRLAAEAGFKPREVRMVERVAEGARA